MELTDFSVNISFATFSVGGEHAESRFHMWFDLETQEPIDNTVYKIAVRNPGSGFKSPVLLKQDKGIGLLAATALTAQIPMLLPAALAAEKAEGEAELLRLKQERLTAAIKEAGPILHAALIRLLASAGEDINALSDDELRVAANDAQADPVTREQAAATLEAREAVRSTSAAAEVACA